MMGRQIIECVTNFSEGRNMEIINTIAATINATPEVTVLNIDPGEATNRTVITYAGEASAVVEAAFNSVKVAYELIDMRQHKGTHPRLGAVDVLPLVPISDITLEECATLARNLAKRIAEELYIPSYCYEAAAFSEWRRNLANCRKGEYEALPDRVISDNDAPDFGARPYDDIIARSGAINIGARDFLIAVNFNLNTTSTKVANEIAAEVRESGKAGKAGRLKACKAIGWFIEEYGIAQVSMNLTRISITPLHKAFKEVCKIATSHGVTVTGTEIIGLVPEKVLIEAGESFSQSEKELSKEELIQIAIQTMHLDDLKPFDPDKKILERVMISSKNQ